MDQPLTTHQTHSKLLLLPLLGVCAFVVAINVWAIAFRLAWPSPLNPWESAYIIAGETAARGGSVYNDPGDPKSGIGVEGPAAVMYGPALPFVLGPLVKLFGPWPYYARVLSLVATFGLIVLAVALEPRRSVLSIVITTGAVVAINWRSRLMFTDARPDMLAWLFAGLAIVAFYRAHELGRRWWYLPGTVLLLIGFLFKQTVIIYAAVPLLMIACTNGFRPRREWIVAMLPAATLVLVVLLSVVFAWNVYHYSIRMPSYWPLRWPRVWDAMVNAIVYDPFFVLCVAIWIVRPEMPHRRVMSWLLTTAAVGIVGGALFFAKSGGSYNSYIPAWLPAAVFSAATLYWLIHDCPLTPAMRRLAVAIVAPLALLASTIALPRGFDFIVDSVHGHRNYSQAVEMARKLPGKVVCPEDPTIILAARGELGRTYTVEMESIQYRYIPAAMQQEMHNADWLIWVGSPFTELLETIDMERLGYVPVFDSGFEPNTYILWKRDWSLQPMKLRQSTTKTRGPGRPTTQPTTNPAADDDHD